ETNPTQMRPTGPKNRVMACPYRSLGAGLALPEHQRGAVLLVLAVLVFCVDLVAFLFSISSHPDRDQMCCRAGRIVSKLAPSSAARPAHHTAPTDRAGPVMRIGYLETTSIRCRSSSSRSRVSLPVRRTWINSKRLARSAPWATRDVGRAFTAPRARSAPGVLRR